MSLLYTLLAVAPIAVVFALMVVMARSATISMGAAYIVTVVLALLVWGAKGAVVGAATLHGVITAITLLFIVFVALFLFYVLKAVGLLYSLRQGFVDSSQVRLCQFIIVVWLYDVAFY